MVKEIKNPYMDLPPRAFWKTAVSRREVLDIADLWRPKFPIDQKTRMVTFGSCFAQHFSRSLKQNGYSWLDCELAPGLLNDDDKKRFNYDVFSARTGNIYTASQLKQWAAWAVGAVLPPDEVWEKNGRFFDPFRPSVEPNGFDSASEVEKSRNVTIDSMNMCAKRANVFVFTLGLTESWFNSETCVEYPMCPGTVAGIYEEEKHEFLRQPFEFVLSNMREAIALLRSVNQNLKFLLTVSPVPLAATNSDEHVLVATSASKAILRAVAESLKNDYDFVDYFPSFEIINSPVFGGQFFEDNQRAVRKSGVDFVMKSFFSSLEGGASAAPNQPRAKAKVVTQVSDADVLCDEEILSVFAEGNDTK